MEQAQLAQSPTRLCSKTEAFFERKKGKASKLSPFFFWRLEIQFRGRHTPNCGLNSHASDKV
jgi:hypothetical protein